MRAPRGFSGRRLASARGREDARRLFRVASGRAFRDITTLLKDGPAWAAVLDHLASTYGTARVEIVVGVESRGFIFGGALAHQLRAGFVPVRKRGKLPA